MVKRLRLRGRFSCLLLGIGDAYKLTRDASAHFCPNLI